MTIYSINIHHLQHFGICIICLPLVGPAIAVEAMGAAALASFLTFLVTRSGRRRPWMSQGGDEFSCNPRKMGSLDSLNRHL